MVGSFQSSAKPSELICLPESQSFPLPCSSSSFPGLGDSAASKLVKIKEPRNLQVFFKWRQK